MAISKKLLKNSKTIGSNPQALKNVLLGKRALVINKNIDGLAALAVKDFYHAVILENDLYTESVHLPDIIVYPDSTPYRSNLLYFDRYFSNESSIFVINYETVDVINKLNKKTNYFSLNYLPTTQAVGSDAKEVRGIVCGLNSDSPGVHLAKIMGCQDIYYTGSSSEAISVDLNDIQAFVSEKGRFAPANFIATNRKILINTIAI